MVLNAIGAGVARLSGSTLRLDTDHLVRTPVNSGYSRSAATSASMDDVSETDRNPIPSTDITVLGLGAMGSALATASARRRPLRDRLEPHAWPRQGPGRPAAPVPRTRSPRRCWRSPVVIACLLDHSSVEETLGLARRRAARPHPGQRHHHDARTRPVQLASWAAEHGIDYLDGAIMAVPAMIGSRAGQIFYSGSRAAYDALLPTLDVWTTSDVPRRGRRPGVAGAIWRCSSGMYQMFTGFFHGAAMVATMGMSASDFARRAGSVPRRHDRAARRLRDGHRRRRLHRRGPAEPGVLRPLAHRPCQRGARDRSRRRSPPSRR